MNDDEITKHDVRLYAALEDSSTALEAERRRIAGLMQSTLVEPLNTLVAQTAAYEQTMGSNPQARMAVSVLGSLARQLMQQALNLQSNLHPTTLEVLGLEPALENLCGQEMRASGVQIQLETSRLRQRLPVQVELALFRAAQDCLQRAIHYAKASRISVRLEIRDERLWFSCSDNGLPINDDLLRAALRRISTLGGGVQVKLLPAFELQIHFPIEAPIELTERERDVLNALLSGKSNKEIATALTISTRTVKFHLDNIYSKLGVNTRTEAAIYALRNGWFAPDHLDSP